MDYFDYDRIPDYDYSPIPYDTYDIKDKIQQPVVLQKCELHLRNCFTLNDAMSNWNQSKSITCPYCQTTSNNPADLRKDIRGQVAQQFHISVESVQIIEGILTHKYNRKKRFTEPIKNTQRQLPYFLLKMKNRFQQSNSISSILQQQYTNQQKVVFYAYCLLDKVKIVLPVRILKCDHPECYELTSLLAYRDQQEKLLEEDKKKIFECCHPSCSNTLNISTLQDLIDGIVLDVDLLNIMNKSLPCQFKFTYLLDKRQFEQEQQQDPIIKILYDTLLTNYEKQYLDLQGFISQVQALTVAVMQGDIQATQEKILKQGMFKTKEINMVDPLTKQIIEFPVRCTKCTHYDQCMDVRSFVANHILSKQRKQTTNKCILCGTEYRNQGALDSKIVYFDQNILSKMFKDMSYQQTKEFTYDGKQYMLNQFLTKQKWPRQKYLEQLQRQGKGAIVEFSNLHCVSDQQKKLQIPLIIQNCPMNSIIDFDTFYATMVDIDFKIEEKPLTFCYCQYCYSNPIQSYTKSLFYHEAFGEALQALKAQKVKVPNFKYDFNQKTVVMQLRKGDRDLDQANVGQQKFQNGFLDLTHDELYQKCFQPKQLEGKHYRLIKMGQVLFNGLFVVHEQSGIKADLKQLINQMNLNANMILRKYYFRVLSISIEFDNSNVRFNVGTIEEFS